MWTAVVWIIYGLCVGIFLLWCILPLGEFRRLLEQHRK